MNPLKSLRRRYEDLSEPYRALLRLRALTGGLSRSLLPECLRESDAPAPRGRTWNAVDIRGALHALRGLGLLDERERVVPELEHELAVEGLHDMAPAVRRVLRRGTGIHTAALRMRLAAYERDAGAFRRVRADIAALEEGGADPFAGQFTEAPVPGRWIASLPPPIALDIVANNLLPLVEAGRFTPNLASCLEALPRLRPALADLPPCPPLILFDALAGRHTEARAQLVPFLVDRTEWRGPFFQGIIAFLEGGDALPALREAQKRFRKAAGKRKALLPGVGGLCLALALIRTERPAEREECAALLHDLPSRQPGAKGLAAARALLARAEGRADARPPRQLESLPDDPLSEAVYRAVDAGFEDGAHDGAAVRALADRYRDTLPLVARLFEDTLERLGGSAAREEGAPRVRLNDFLDRRPDWERAFDALTQRLLPAPAPESPPKRLAWLLDPLRLRVEAAEQVQKNGAWTPGSPLPLKRLYEDAASLDWLTEQDRAVLASLRWTRTWNGATCEADPRRTPPLLAGHPNLLRSPDRAPITLTCKPVELIVRQEGDGYRVSLSRWLPPGEMQCVEAAPLAYILYHLPRQLEGAAEVLGPQGLRVPPEGAPRLLGFIGALDEHVVRPILRAEETAACARVIVRLRPVGTGLEAALFIRPFGEPDTPAFPVGGGPAAPLASVGGRILRAERDFEEERYAARDLARRCPTLRERGGMGLGSIAVPEEALDCLLEIGKAGLPVEWPEGEAFRVFPAVAADRLSVDVRHSRDWFAVHGELRVDESLVLDMERLLERLKEAKGRFVPLGDGAFLALTEQFRRRLERLERLTESDGRHRRLHPLAADTVRDLFEGAQVRGDGAWESLLRRAARAGAEAPAVPPALHAELRGYQREGFVWMARLARRGAGACLADDMGLGKTLQTIAVLLDQAPLGPSIVLAPTSVCHNWENELARFAPTLGVHRFGPGDRAAQVAALGPGDVLIASYGLLHTEAALLAGRDWQMAVFDEAQALKNADTRRARAGRRLRAAFRVALTGTPIENRLEDLWSLFNLINPGLLGTRQSFQKRFAAVSAPSTRGTEAEAGTGAKARCEGGGAPSVLGLNAQEATRYEGRAGAAEKSPNQYEGRNEASSVLGLSGRATPQYKGGAGAAQSSQNQYEGKAEASSALGLGEQATARYGALNGAAEGFQERYEGEAETSSARGLGGQVTARYEALNGAAEGFQGHYEGGAGARYEEGSGGLSGTLAGRPSATGPERTPEAPSGAQSEARAALRALVRPFILRRTKSQVLTELPPRMEQVLEVDLPEDERAFYEALRRTALASLEEPGDEGSRKLNILTELMKLRRACCAPALVDPGVKLPGAKLGAFMDLAAELVRGGHKALVFSQFVGCLAEARRRLEAGGFACQYLDGATPERERQSRVASFQAGKGDFFLISLKAGGQGLNLTAADYVIHLDPWWNPAVEDQASDRAYRLGQERPVTVYRLVARDTVEEAILRLHRSKRALAADILDGADVPLSEAELLELLRTGGLAS